MYIVVKRTITVESINDANKRNEKITFKNIASVRSCISKINNKFVDNGENFGIVMMVQHLLDYCSNYCMMVGRLWSYDRDDANENIDAENYRINNKKSTTSKFSEYKTKLIGPAPANTFCSIKIFE